MNKEKPVRLVITSPSKLGVEFSSNIEARTTAGVLSELLAESKHKVILSSPYIQGIETLQQMNLLDPLYKAINREVRVILLSTASTVRKKRKVSMLKKNVEFYCPRPNIQSESELGSHAKFCISDESKAYLGSANFTRPGLSISFELGVIIHKPLTFQLLYIWKELISNGFLVSYERIKK